MASDWKELRLDELVDFTPKRTIKKGTIAPFISMADVTENSKFIPEVFEKEYTGGGSRFTNGDTLFARITPCLQNGKCSKVSGMTDGAIGHGSTEFIVLAAKNPECDEDYIYYLTRWPHFRAYAESRMIGSTGRQRVSWQELGEYELLVPEKNERKRIGGFLSALDEKIEINRKTNKTLEAMAQALFKSWFIDFDPVIDNALAAGKSIPDELMERAEQRQAVLDAGQNNLAMRGLFPDEFEFTEEMGWIPKGWLVKNLTEIANFQNGFAFYTTGYSDSGYKVVDLANIHTDGRFVETHRDKYVSPEIYDLPKHEKHRLYKGDIVMAMTDMTQAMGILGKCGKIYESNKYILNQRIGRIRVKKSININFLLTYLNSTYQLDFLKTRVLGTVQKYVNTTHIKEMNFVVPPNEVMNRFGDIVDPQFNKIRELDETNETLEKLRDTLLPKLLSGELRIPDAERRVDEAL